METEATCGVCRADAGRYMCKACNMKVCSSCHDKKSGLCIICKESGMVEYEE